MWVWTGEGADSYRQDRGSGDKQVGWEFTPPPYSLLPITCSLFWALSWDPSLLAPHPSHLGLLPAPRSPQPLPCQCPPAVDSWEGLCGHVLSTPRTLTFSRHLRHILRCFSDQIVHIVLYLTCDCILGHFRSPQWTVPLGRQPLVPFSRLSLHRAIPLGLRASLLQVISSQGLGS